MARKKQINWLAKANSKELDRMYHEQPEFVRQIVDLVMDNPTLTARQIAKELNMAYPEVWAIMQHSNYLRAMRYAATAKVANMVPLAVEGIKDSLESPNADVKYKASVRVLENENVVGGQKLDLTVNDLRSMPNSRLREIIDSAKAIPAQTIDEELLE